ncbi:MAG TPA: hypothetical protein P5513_06355, partial [Candidatus Diapherotrites archaeon]|nr:hypothetical protein [Candidatus Diapherotrites archaeon]
KKKEKEVTKMKDYFGVTVSNEGILMDISSKKYLTSEEAKAIVKKHGYPFYTPQWEVLDGFNKESQDLYDLYRMKPDELKLFIKNNKHPKEALRKINDLLPIYCVNNALTPIISSFKEDVKTPYVKILKTSEDVIVSIGYF